MINFIMKFIQYFIGILFLLHFDPECAGQEIPRKLTLDQVIDIAQEQSPDALSAKNRFLKSFWELRTSEALLLPKLNFDATLPNITRSIDKITQPDGSDAFRERALANTSAELSLSKNVGLTGGQVYLKSNLQRIDYFADSTPTAWLSSPLIIGYQQNIFTFNPYKWSKKIDPIKYREAKRLYLESVEQIALSTTNLFFNLLTSQYQKKIAEQNAANYDTLYQIAIGRFNLGKIPENDLLQLELSLLNAQADMENTSLTFEDRMFKLKSYLRMQDDQSLELIPPVNEIAFFEIPVEQAIMLANDNNSKSLEFERRLLESDREVNRAQRNNRFSATLFAQYGLTQSGAQVGQAYENPQDQQQLSFGIHIPILDWGLAKGRIKVAESDREIARTAIEQERIDFEQNVYLEVMNFKMQQRQLQIAAKSDTVANKGYEISKQRYMIGKISITDLNTAQINSDGSKISFIRSLQNYWLNYYRIRKLTVYDFKSNNEISIDFDKLR
nr:TolC family protein [Bacteroidota bacterium]